MTDKTPSIGKSMQKGGLILGAVALISAILLSGTNLLTKEHIAANEKAFLLQKLNKILPKSQYDNDLGNDTRTIPADILLGTKEAHQAYLARKDDNIIAVFLNPIARDGYNGNIHLLVAVTPELSVAGVRVVKHQETVGLADGIEDTKSDWILGFKQKSLANTNDTQWHVKKDGGVFDQFTGATISPRAIVKAVRNALSYAKQHPEIFAP